MEREKVKAASEVEEGIKMFKEDEMGKRKFQKKHAKAILLCVFGVNPKASANKSQLVELIEKEVEKHPDKINDFVPTENNLPAAALPSAPSAAAAMPADNESFMAQGLYERCVSAVQTMGMEMSPLELAILIVGIVRRIERNGYVSDESENNGSIEYDNLFFQAFDSSVAKRRDIDFIHELAGMVPSMIEDVNLNEESLRKCFKEHEDSTS